MSSWYGNKPNSSLFVWIQTPQCLWGAPQKIKKCCLEELRRNSLSRVAAPHFASEAEGVPAECLMIVFGCECSEWKCAAFWWPRINIYTLPISSLKDGEIPVQQSNSGNNPSFIQENRSNALLGSPHIACEHGRYSELCSSSQPWVIS